MSERLAQKKVVKYLRDHDVDVQRIENTVDRGVPDINCCYDGLEFWIEMKSTASKTPKLRPEQQAWHARRHFHGGIVLIITEHSKTDEYSVYIFHHKTGLTELSRAPKKEFFGTLLEMIDFMRLRHTFK